TYETEVKKPFDVFTNDLSIAINKFDKEVAVDPKNAIFRINRDIRFAKDKAPYKLNRSCAISKYGKRDHATPGYYVEVTADKVGMAGGAWAPAPELLYKIRQEIAYNMDDFSKLVADKKFIAAFGEVKGEKGKVIPKEFREEAKEQPLIFNKNFYYWKELKPSLITSDKLLDTIVEHFSTVLLLNQFFRRAME
ncbi:MAG: DUF2461 domain-containing protein, partial [Bacteroidetes bacterium]|nr:DUF2461 domain-containing protein [Bacteroidota bacterium]